MLRINGSLRSLTSRLHPLDAEECQALVNSVMPEAYHQQLEVNGEVDFARSIVGMSRYRVHVYKQRGSLCIAIRVLFNTMPTLAGLGLPALLERLTERTHGLVLVTGPTGSGKSSTLAALVDTINRREAKHIVTLEDPIEYLHVNCRSLIHQREIGSDTPSFERGLRSALRQDPDVILIGEMRDWETAKTAITAAETGHLVLSTLHTPDAVQSIDRIVDLAPFAQHAPLRSQLAGVLTAIVSQRLLPTGDGQGRVVVCELLINTPAVANLIRSDKVHQIKSVMQTGKQYGMQTMDMHLQALLAAGTICASDVQEWEVDALGSWG